MREKQVATPQVIHAFDQIGAFQRQIAEALAAYHHALTEGGVPDHTAHELTLRLESRLYDNPHALAELLRSE